MKQGMELSKNFPLFGGFFYVIVDIAQNSSTYPWNEVNSAFAELETMWTVSPLMSRSDGFSFRIWVSTPDLFPLIRLQLSSRTETTWSQVWFQNISQCVCEGCGICNVDLSLGQMLGQYYAHIFIEVPDKHIKDAVHICICGFICV